MAINILYTKGVKQNHYARIVYPAEGKYPQDRYWSRRKSCQKQTHPKKNLLHVSEVDDNLQELSPHGSFELPVETYMANCEIFHALYDHWHSEMEIMYIEKGSGFARLNRESIRLKKGDILIVNCGVLHSMRTDLKKPLYYKSVVFSLGFLAGQPGDICQECVVSPINRKQRQNSAII